MALSVLWQKPTIMKKVFALLLLAGIGFSLYAQKTINDPNVQKRSVTGYHGVAISGSIELFLTQGEESVAVSADDVKWRDKIVTEVKNGILLIHLEDEKKLRIEWGPNSKKLRAYVSVKNIDELTTAGSGKIHIEGKLKTDDLKVTITGSGNMDGQIEANDLKISISGSANTDLSGKAQKSEFHISGSGNIRGYELVNEVCEITISGSGNVRTTVNKELSARISGSGNVSIKGNGQLKDYTSSGSGKFHRVD
jgi:putative autotransporter adhesin-like protein